jgi:hypothetical protein
MHLIRNPLNWGRNKSKKMIVSTKMLKKYKPKKKGTSRNLPVEHSRDDGILNEKYLTELNPNSKHHKSKYKSNEGVKHVKYDCHTLTELNGKSHSFAQSGERRTFEPKKKSGLSKVLSHATSMDEKNFNLVSNKSSNIGGIDLKSTDRSCSGNWSNIGYMTHKSSLLKSNINTSRSNLVNVESSNPKLKLMASLGKNKIINCKMMGKVIKNPSKNNSSKRPLPGFKILPQGKIRSAKISPAWSNIKINHFRDKV